MKTTKLPSGLCVHNVEGVIIGTLYDTRIVIYNTVNQEVFLDSGLSDLGRKSVHTKKCMNLLLKPYGIRVIQKNFEWFANGHKFDGKGYCTFNHNRD